MLATDGCSDCTAFGSGVMNFIPTRGVLCTPEKACNVAKVGLVIGSKGCTVWRVPVAGCDLWLHWSEGWLTFGGPVS